MHIYWIYYKNIVNIEIDWNKLNKAVESKSVTDTLLTAVIKSMDVTWPPFNVPGLLNTFMSKRILLWTFYEYIHIHMHIHLINI